MSATIGEGSLRTVMDQAREMTGYNLGQLTVLSPQTDPYRLDIPANRSDAEWFAEQFERFVADDATVHLRGFHYIMLASCDVAHPSGRQYQNDDWRWMSDEASKYARMLGYVPFERINDERNAQPEIFTEAGWKFIQVSRTDGSYIDIPDSDDIVPRFVCHLTPGQKYRIAFIGEKSSLKPILGPIAERIKAELLLPNGEASTTMIAGMARRAADDGRPLKVLYFSDFDPSGWQMPISVARKLQALKDLHYPNLEAQVYPVAMTLEQVVNLGLPSSALKEKEERAGAWIAAFGREQTEIDALAALRPAELRRMAEQAILPFYDPTLASRTWRAQREWERQADAGLAENENYQNAKTTLTETCNQLDELVERVNDARQTVLDILYEAELPDAPELPEAEIDVQAPEPIFTTEDDYVTATLKLKARKRYEGGQP